MLLRIRKLVLANAKVFAEANDIYSLSVLWDAEREYISLASAKTFALANDIYSLSVLWDAEIHGIDNLRLGHRVANLVKCV